MRDPHDARGPRDVRDFVRVPRWALYGQAALLGVAAVTFFIFGMMVGQVTAPRTSTPAGPAYGVLRGSVYAVHDGQREPDEGAVVLWLPAGIKPEPRPDPGPLRPANFQPLDNPSVALIRELGGDVVRVDPYGEYRGEVRAGRDYWMLVLSRSRRRSGSAEITKSMRAELGAWFFPVESLLNDSDFRWSPTSADSSDRHLPAIVFD